MARQTASLSGDFDTAREMVDRAVAFNPNASIAWGDRGWTYLIAGQPEEAIRSFERVIRLSPFDPCLFSTFTGMSIAFIGLGRFDEAVAAAKKALQTEPGFCACLSLSDSRSGALWGVRQKLGSRQRPAAGLEADFRISEWHSWSALAPSDVHRRPPQSRTSGVTRRPRFPFFGTKRSLRCWHRMSKAKRKTCARREYFAF